MHLQEPWSKERPSSPARWLRPTHRAIHKAAFRKEEEQQQQQQQQVMVMVMVIYSVGFKLGLHLV